MCCHKTCSWQRLNIQWDSVLLRQSEPWVLPSQLSSYMFLSEAPVHHQSHVGLTFWFLHCTAFQFTVHPVEDLKGGKKSAGALYKNVLYCHHKILWLWRDMGPFGSARLQIYFSDKDFRLTSSLLKGKRNPEWFKETVCILPSGLSPLDPFNVKSCGFHNLLELKNRFVLLLLLQTSSASP